MEKLHVIIQSQVIAQYKPPGILSSVCIQDVLSMMVLIGSWSLIFGLLAHRQLDIYFSQSVSIFSSKVCADAAFKSQ